MTTGAGGRRGRGGTESGPRERCVLAGLAFTLLFGQPVVVFALAVLSPGVPELAVITLGTVALAATTARAYVRRGGSVGRLGEFLLVLAAVQLVVAVSVRVALAVLQPTGLALAATRPAIVVVSYPLAYYVFLQVPRGSVLALVQDDG